jgi:hypothetical protein
LIVELELRNLRKTTVLAMKERYRAVGKPINSVVTSKSREIKIKERNTRLDDASPY